MSTSFLDAVNRSVDLPSGDQPTVVDGRGVLIAATPAIAGAAVVCSALLAYAVEEAGDS